jgi:hypothetical protein
MIDEQAYLRALDAAEVTPNEVNCRLVLHLSRAVVAELIRLRNQAAKDRQRVHDLEGGQRLMPL